MSPDGVDERKRVGVGRKSEHPVVPPSPGNPPEGPGGGKGMPDHGTVQGKDTEMSGSDPVSTKQEQIAKLAREMPDRALTSLNRHLDLELLRAAWERTRKDGALGVDGQTAADYAVNLEENLLSLLERAKSGSYRAPPVRRVYIPKGRGERRPLGLPTLEDKILQRAVLMLLEPVYEQDFLPCSYGFRRGRSAHQAVEAIRNWLMDHDGGTVLEVDIRRFFDTLDRTYLREILRQRVNDGVLLRLIGKWLNAGVLENLVLSYPDSGTPQGGVISPLLANVYLHEVVDKWFADQVTPVMHGAVHLVRYADDFVLLFELETDADRVHAVLAKRFAKYGLELHPEKTRLVSFRRPPRSAKSKKRPGPPGPRSFNFLGFTHYWGRSRRGNSVVKQKTAKDRFARAAGRIREWCRSHRHDPIAEQHDTLSRKLRGHYGYYGITGNHRLLALLRRLATRSWFYWLSRRAQRRQLTWARFTAMLERYPLPTARVVHSVYRSANP